MSSNLNGAYYGPSIPSQKSYNRVGRGFSCNPCTCLFSFIFKLIFSIIITLGIIALVLWLIFRPNQIKAYVTAADLTTFTLPNSNNNLQYNLSMTMAIRNPNKRIGLYYDYIEAQALYDDARFGYVQLPIFYQGHKNTTTLFPVFTGTSFVNDVRSTYNREKGEGYYYVHVKLYTKLRLRLNSLMKIHRKPHVDCKLKLRVPGSNNAAFMVPAAMSIDFEFFGVFL